MFKNLIRISGSFSKGLSKLHQCAQLSIAGRCHRGEEFVSPAETMLLYALYVKHGERYQLKIYKK